MTNGVPPTITNPNVVYSRPIQLRQDSKGLKSEMTLMVVNKMKGGVVQGVRFSKIDQNVPCSIWGAYDPNANALLPGDSQSSTVTQLMGLQVMSPLPSWSTVNPVKMHVGDSIQFVTTESKIGRYEEQERDWESYVKTYESGQNQTMARYEDSRSALLVYMNAASNMTESTFNVRRRAIMDQWARIRGLQTATPGSTASLQSHTGSPQFHSDVPTRYAKSIERFCLYPIPICYG